MDNAKVKQYGMLFLVGIASVITATYLVQLWNKPKTAPPNTTTA